VSLEVRDAFHLGPGELHVPKCIYRL
jgi:hypothetical protein